MPKGVITNPKGRGNSPNKATAGAREAIAKFVDGNAHRLEKWLDAIAKDNPMAAFDRYMAVVEYHIPKLQRSEITGKDGKELFPGLSDEQMIERIRNLIALGRQARDEPKPLASVALPGPESIDAQAIDIIEQSKDASK